MVLREDSDNVINATWEQQHNTSSVELKTTMLSILNNYVLCTYLRLEWISVSRLYQYSAAGVYPVTHLHKPGSKFRAMALRRYLSYSCVMRFIADSYCTQLKEQHSKWPDISLWSWGQRSFIMGWVTTVERALSNRLWSKVWWAPEVKTTEQISISYVVSF